MAATVLLGRIRRPHRSVGMMQPDGLADAFDPPLIEAPLQLDQVTTTERGESLADAPAADEIPVVTIGVPRAAPVSALASTRLDGGAHMSVTAPVIGADETAFLLRLACSFRPRSDSTEIIWARFTARLLADGDSTTAVALDLYPSAVEVERKVSRRILVSPSLKLAEVEAGVGEGELTIEYPAVEPVISAGGTQESTISWDFSQAPGYTVRGGKLLVAVIAAPRETRRLEVACTVQADLRYRGLRWPSWLGGRTPSARDGQQAVAWQRP